MKAQVYRIDWDTYQENPQSVKDILDKFRDDLQGRVAIKVHFGEPGNENAIRGQTLKPITDWVVKNKINGFLTDTNTLYTGFRNEKKVHLDTAKKHGFGELNIPIEIADDDFPEFKLTKLKNQYKKLPIRLGKELMEADSILCISHLKGHRLFGYGGALKNLGMGGATPSGKRVLHANIAGQVNHDLCTLCGLCSRNCPAKAISQINQKTIIDQNKCIGCGECVTVCPQGAIEVPERDSKISQEKTAVYAYGLAGRKSGIYINFLININSLCDCASQTQPILLPNLGIMISDNPVALDQASLDWINKVYGKDLFKEVNGVDYQYILSLSEDLGLGNREYQEITYYIPN